MKHDGHGARSAMSTTRVVVLGFAFVILMGALLLTLPIASANGVSVGFFDALFTLDLLRVRHRSGGGGYGNGVLHLWPRGHHPADPDRRLGFMSVAMLYFMVLGKRGDAGHAPGDPGIAQ